MTTIKKMTTLYIVLIVLAVAAVLGVSGWLVYEYALKKKDTTKPVELSFVQNQSLQSNTQRSWGGQHHLEQTDMEVHSVQYYFTSIQLAQAVDTTGTGYSNPKGVLSLYSRNQEGYEAFGYAEGVSDDSGGYKELLDDSFVVTPDLSSISVPTAYNYILLNWMRPLRIRATAKAKTVNGVEHPALYTKSGGTNALATDSSGPQDYTAYQTTVKNMHQAPAETAVVLNQNGGSFLKLQKPLTIDPNKQQKVVLVVDPYVNFRAGKGLGTSFYSLRDEDNDAFFNVPISDMTAVVIEADAQIVRHRYRVVLDKGEIEQEPQWDMLIQTYASSKAPEDLLAVNLSIIKQEADEVLHEDAPQAAANVFFLEKDAQGWHMKEYDSRAFVRNFNIVDNPDRGTCEVRCSYQICGTSMVMQQEQVYRTVPYTKLD